MIKKREYRGYSNSSSFTQIRRGDGAIYVFFKSDNSNADTNWQKGQKEKTQQE